MSKPLIRLAVLGPFELVRESGDIADSGVQGQPLPQLRRKTRALLAYLADAPRPMRREALAALFFPSPTIPSAPCAGT
jgi:hypothetical protein